MPIEWRCAFYWLYYLKKTLLADFIAEVIDLFTKDPTNRRFMEKQQEEIVRNYSLYGFSTSALFGKAKSRQNASATRIPKREFLRAFSEGFPC